MVEPEAFRELFGSFPTAVSVVTTLDAEGRPRGFTCSALTSVSADPPLLLVCVDRRSQTLPAMAATGAFAVHVLAEGGERTAQRFAGRSGDRFAGLDWEPSALAGGVPLLEGPVLGRAECRTVRTVEAGDHRIVIGRVEGARVFPRRPLLHRRGAYGVWHGAGELLGAAG
ncbi:flavin reductase family protein [Streptacidiphilus sp. ASG 303]|uniref:flavin reductase family protein n=1 Tax=Streptacidiphilus sp. ASG 303 TaxID=2896847 RepID=UPI001E321BE8|nr:flavin reductase family protein [Streptacidiphilus sp. ASG 303]MCD0486340.1 flavin reductase family protein [Streptacidiphilus sp. ASG 303]